jgi:hypothetical protein
MKNNKVSKNTNNGDYVTKTQVKQLLLSVTEPKVYSSQFSGANTTTTGFTFNLTNGIVQGDDVNMRSGTKIEVRAIRLALRGVSVAADATIRFVLYSDMFNIGTFPTTSQVLPTSGIMSHYSDVREIQQHRFRILHDETMDLSRNGPSVKTTVTNISRKFPIYYNGTTTGAASEGKGAISLLVIASTATEVYDYDFQVVYNDS